MQMCVVRYVNEREMNMNMNMNMMILTMNLVGIPLYWTRNERSFPQSSYSVNEDNQKHSALL